MQFFSKKNMLFPRLLLSFLIVMLIPVVMISLYYSFIASRSLIQSLQKQSQISSGFIADSIKNSTEMFQKKAVELADAPIIIQTLNQDILTEKNTQTQQLYNFIFSIMGNTILNASAHIISNSGNVRYSTHDFPSQYDLRYNRNEVSPFFELERKTKTERTHIFLSNHYITSKNNIIFLTILQRVYNEKENPIGYVVIEVFKSVFNDIGNDFIFDELYLIDNSNFLAASLINSDLFGNFEKFPQLMSISSLKKAETNIKKDFIQTIQPIENTPFTVVGIIETQHHIKNMQQTFIVLPAFIFFGLLIAGITALLITRSMVKPIDGLVSAMQAYSTRKEYIHTQKSGIYELDMLNSSFDNMVFQIHALAAAERKTLESQLNPHFLFNTLNTVHHIAKENNQKDIALLISKLGNLLQNILENDRAEVTVKESIDLVEDYLIIQRIRFGGKLHVKIEVSEDLYNVKIPKLIIQPLIENAIVHGLEPKKSMWLITLSIRKDAKFMHIQINDNGVGFDSSIIPADLSQLENTPRMGIYNIYRRLITQYGKKCAIIIDSQKNEGTCVDIRIPLEALNV